ncbi:cytochrome c oxidase accessory protein CcoG [Ahrensia sp. R2A130]|uniref:cytochrome c oxidase accessory protein CcoG n=1 Tax=Ahrensia sp. R2A130 TaxID=744979 RepID=UPI0001E0C9E7|nr:cytochrome c oxidase accessory protein CcoG [Ahrensia sp. R2A130]EFL89401.1 cytochrome c oxidase accessory protein CcoG [Ahrensia sp. R2A130]
MLDTVDHPDDRKIADTDVENFDAEPVNSKANQSLYVARKKIHPKRAEGFYRKLKWWIMLVTLGIYYVTPWLRWDRGPGTPDQAVLIDMANRRFYFLFIEIWPHEFFYVAGLLVMAGIGLFLVTSILGRAWCGYTCPQTVWVDLFLVVERFFEGDRNARIKLDAAPWNADKVTKRTAKHAVWLLIGIATGGAWIFYFADAPTLAIDLFTLQAPPIAYITVAILTATTYVFGGLMREQVCTYMCPWPRIQAAMLDEHSLTVTYNAWRGEPRSLHMKRQRREGVPVGDCVDCNACVAVCPMGIDIRDGQQMECITCALCIDACDNVMDKLGLEKGLIAYSTLEDYTHNMQIAGAYGTIEELTSAQGYPRVEPQKVRGPTGRLIDAVKLTGWHSILRPRTFIYALIFGSIGLALLTVLALRDTLDVNILHDRNPLFVTLSDGSTRNGYEIKILNKRGETRLFWVETEGLPGAQLTVASSGNKPKASLLVEVDADSIRGVKVFVAVPPGQLEDERSEFVFRITAMRGAEATLTGTQFVAPQQALK